MEQEKPNDTEDRRETGPFRVRGRIGTAIADYRETVEYPHRVVYSQEPVWVFDLRLLEYGLEDIGILRVVLRPKTGSGTWFPGHIEWIEGTDK